MRTPYFLVITALLIAAVSTGVWGQEHYEQDFSADRFTWTAEDYERAEPMEPPLLDLDEQSFPLTLDPEGEIVGTDAFPPETNVQPTDERVHDPLSLKRERADDIQEVVRSNVGPILHAPFTSARVYPLSSDRTRFYRTVGRLFFQTPEGGAVCSAVVVGHRALATAAHCVHPGGVGRRFYSGFSFVPAYRNGAAPFGSWPATWAVVSGTWGAGNRNVRNAADYALLEIRDEVRAGQSRRIGDVLGWLGWRTNSLNGNHVTMLGYPGNLEQGRHMRQVTGQSWGAALNNVIFGADFGPGASGSPLVQNFAFATGAGQNQVVGVLSTGDTRRKLVAASILDSRFVGLWNAICARRAGNCS